MKPGLAASWAARWSALLIVIPALGTYLATRSPSLDDFDSFNFARAIDHFDPRASSPQPPGYPAYVLLARWFDLATHDHILALTLLSAIAGAACVLFFSLMARDVGAPWAGALLAAMPLFWISSELALSDVPGLFFAVLAVFLLVRSVPDGVPATSGSALTGAEERHPARRGTVYLLLGAAATAVAAGVRPQDAVVPASIALFFVLPRLVAQRRLAEGLWALAVFIGGCAAWALPLARSAGGLPSLVRLLGSQGSYVGATDSLLSRPLNWTDLGLRLGEFGSVFGAYFGGPSDGGLPAFLVLAAALLVLSVACRSARLRWLAWTWLLPYAAFMVATARPDDPRKVLPAVPPMLLLVAGAFSSRMGPAATVRSRWRPVLWVAPPAAVLVLFVFRGAQLVRTLDTVMPPPVQAAGYIRAHFDRRNTLVVAGLSYNAVRYYLPDYPSYFLEAIDARSFARDTSSGAFKNIILLDKEGPALPDSYVGTDTLTFRRDPLVLPKASEVWMALYQPVSVLEPPQFALPAGPVHVGTKEDVRYLLGGWYRPETIAGVTARWTSGEAQVRFWIAQPAASVFSVACVSFPARQTLTLVVNGQEAGTIDIGQDWSPYRIRIPAGLLKGQAINTIVLRHSRVVSPAEATHGQSTDQRQIAVAYTSFSLNSQ